MCKKDKDHSESIDELADSHLMIHSKTPLRDDAFELSDKEKIKKITAHIASVLETLGMDLTDDSLKSTPKRVAKAYVKELFSGLHPNACPGLSTFKNNYAYDEMLVEKNIVVYSTCEHHLLPIIGKAHVAYFAKDRVIGLSKINRLVDYFAKRPQVQERLTIQIVAALQEILNTEDVACVIDAKHLCVNSRGIRDIESSTLTAKYGGRFKDEKVKAELLHFIKMDTKIN